MRLNLFYMIFCGLCLFSLPFHAQAQFGILGGFNQISPEQERNLGRQLAREIEEQKPIIHNPRVQAYIDDLGKRVLVGAGRPQFIYRFRVVDELDVNAFAIFAGHVYVNRGLILMAQSEGQLASVMAHEIGHIQARHPAKRLAAMQNVNLLGGLASLLLGSMTGQGTGRLLQSGLKLFGTAGILHYSREQEEEADALGVHYLYQAGFDPRDTVRMFRLLEEIQGQRQSPIGEFFSSHPSPRTRMEKVEGIIATLPKQPAFAERPEKFSAIQERLSRGILRGGYRGRRYLDILK